MIDFKIIPVQPSTTFLGDHIQTDFSIKIDQLTGWVYKRVFLRMVKGVRGGGVLKGVCVCISGCVRGLLKGVLKGIPPHSN